MKKWYQGIVVEHKELDNKMYHCFDDENFEKLTNERNEQLKEIERLNNIIKKAIEFIYENAYDEERENCIDDLWGEIPKLLDILKGSDKE